MATAVAVCRSEEGIHETSISGPVIQPAPAGHFCTVAFVLRSIVCQGRGMGTSHRADRGSRVARLSRTRITWLLVYIETPGVTLEPRIPSSVVDRATAFLGLLPETFISLAPVPGSTSRFAQETESSQPISMVCPIFRAVPLWRFNTWSQKRTLHQTSNGDPNIGLVQGGPHGEPTKRSFPLGSI